MRKPRFLWIYPVLVLVVLTAHTTERALRVGILLAGLGEALRFWANGYVGHVKANWTPPGAPKIGRLITAGPYAYVRHPLYVGSFLIGVGICVIVGNPWVWVTALLPFVWTYRRKVIQEEQQIAQGWPEYETYRRAVPRWLPTWRHYPGGAGMWSWRGVRASKEWKTAIWVAVSVIALYLREAWWQERGGLSSATPRQFLWLGLLVVLIITDLVVELTKRSEQPA